MNNVEINGVRYVPLTNKPSSVHVNKLSRILAKECPYLARSEIQRVVKLFESDEPEKKPEVKTEKPQKSPKGRAFNYGNFRGFDKDGHILYKRGGRNGHKSKWTMHNVIDIQQWMNHGKRMDGKQIKKIADKYNLTPVLVRDIIYNLNEGHLQLWIDRWIEKSAKKPKTPVINNPQKRKEIGWY